MKKIAIIGGGISGISAAWFLQNEYKVTLFEKNSCLGGHTNTVKIQVDNQTLPTDVGFIVFNEKTYPNFMQLLQAWDVHYAKSDMSFSVSDNNGFEYNGGNLSGLFSCRKNLFNYSFWGMLFDIIKFNFHAKKALNASEKLTGLSLKQFTKNLNLSPMFYEYYLYPMAAAIWSAGLDSIENLSAYFLLQFYENHGLLNLLKRPQWYYIKNGSISYIEKFISLFKGQISCNATIKNVTRENNAIKIVTENGKAADFDAVIFACHADEVLEILMSPDELEKEILLQFPFLKNEVVLHSDPSLMPHHQRAWASWNYLLHTQNDSRPSLSYYMNKLQCLPTQKPIIVTVNPPEKVKLEYVYNVFEYSHPQFSLNSFAAQQKLPQINGKGNVYYCGAYWGYGFHEDGVTSALNTACLLDANMKNNKVTG